MYIWFFNLLSYGELSIYVCFMLSRDTPAGVYNLLLYFDLHRIRHFIMFCYQLSQKSDYLKIFESISL